MNMLLHALRFGVTGNAACTPSFIRVEYNTGEALELEGEALMRLNSQLTQVLMLLAASAGEEADEPLFNSEDFRDKK
jgi:hypothetical protein